MGANPAVQTLILGINKAGDIILFNNECERITGFKKEDILHKKIWDLLLPSSSVGETKKLIESIIQNAQVGDYLIPLKTYTGKEIQITWTGHPTNDEQGLVKDICFIGTIDEKQYMDLPLHAVQTIPLDETIENFIEIEPIRKKDDAKGKLENKQVYSLSSERQMSVQEHKETIRFKQNKRRILFEKKLSEALNQTSPTPQKTLISKKTTAIVTPPVDKPTGTSNEVISDKYDILMKKLKELEKKDILLERKNMILEKNLKQLTLQMEKQELARKRNPEIHEGKPIEMKIEKNGASQKPSHFLKDPFKTKQRQMDFEQQLQVLNDRKKELDMHEVQLTNERKQLDGRINELNIWKNKMTALEAEIEKRWESLQEQERAFLEKKRASEVLIAETTSLEEEGHHGILDKIPQSAAIIQRGILKQINSSFAGLIGFESEEIVNRSLFDFIAPEGLADIEQYYINRLQGNSISTYETVFSTKDNIRIVVEVRIKPTIFNGEKAEIAIVSKIEKKPKLVEASVAAPKEATSPAVDVEIKTKETEIPQEIQSPQ